jgi:hypothetical protein
MTVLKTLTFFTSLDNMGGTLMHYWPMTDPTIVENAPPAIVDSTGNSTTSDGGNWFSGAFTNVTQDDPGNGYTAEASCVKVGMTTGTPSPLSAEVVDLKPNTYNPGSGSDDENSAGMWTRQVNPRVENDFNMYLIRVSGQGSTSQTSYRINHSTNEVQLQHGGGVEAAGFSFTRGSGWNLLGFTETYDSGANQTTFKFYSNGVLINTDVIAGDVGGLHWLGTNRMFTNTFESAKNQNISTSYHQQGAAFIIRNHAITESQWLQLYNAGK